MAKPMLDQLTHKIRSIISTTCQGPGCSTCVLLLASHWKAYTMDQSVRWTPCWQTITL